MPVLMLMPSTVEFPDGVELQSKMSAMGASCGRKKARRMGGLERRFGIG
jgi:hypothetical protein